MDKLEQYRQIIQALIHRYADLPKSNTQIESIALCDPIQDSYMVMDIGWNPSGRVHSVPIHLRIKNQKVWLEWDGTDQEIAQRLMDAGIPQEDIVLAFYRPERQKLTGFALA
jgi:XisI protein